MNSILRPAAYSRRRSSDGVSCRAAKAGDPDELVEKLKVIAARDVKRKEDQEREEAEIEAQKSDFEKKIEKAVKKVDDVIGNDEIAEADKNTIWGTLQDWGSILVVAGTIFVFSSGIIPTSTQAGKLDFGASDVTLSRKERQEAKDMLAQFDQRLQTAPSDLKAVEGSAVLNAKLGNYPQARELLAQLSVAKPEDKEVWRLKAEVEARSEDLESAINSYERAIAIDATSFEIWEGYITALVNNEDFELAMQTLDKAKVLPQEVGILKAGILSRWPGHLVEADKLYTKLIYEHPADLRLYVAKSAFLNDNERYNEAKEVIETAKRVQKVVQEAMKLEEAEAAAAANN